MWKIIQLIIFGHTHEWEIIEQSPLTVHFDYTSQKANGTHYVLRCKKCGNLKEKSSY